MNVKFGLEWGLQAANSLEPHPGLLPPCGYAVIHAAVSAVSSYPGKINKIQSLGIHTQLGGWDGLLFPTTFHFVRVGEASPEWGCGSLFFQYELFHLLVPLRGSIIWNIILLLNSSRQCKVWVGMGPPAHGMDPPILPLASRPVPPLEYFPPILLVDCSLK